MERGREDRKKVEDELKGEKAKRGEAEERAKGLAKELEEMRGSWEAAEEKCSELKGEVCLQTVILPTLSLHFLFLSLYLSPSPSTNPFLTPTLSHVDSCISAPILFAAVFDQFYGVENVSTASAHMPLRISIIQADATFLLCDHTCLCASQSFRLKPHFFSVISRLVLIPGVKNALDTCVILSSFLIHDVADRGDERGWQCAEENDK